MKKRIAAMLIVAMALCAMCVSSLAASTDIGTIMSTSLSVAVADAITGIVAIIPLGLQIFTVMFVVKAGMRMFKGTATATG